MTSSTSAEYMRQNRQRYNLGPMLTSSNVYWALGNRGYTTDPEYVKAVIRNYVHFKAQRGKSKFELGYKLEVLEREFSQFAYAFRAIRQEYGLAPSRVLPQPQASQPSSTLRRTQTATTPSRANTVSANNNITRTRTTVGATTVRPTQTQSEDDPPPPPYASQDPEPAATRQLQERLAAEAEARGNLSQLTSPSAATPTRTPSTSTHPTSPPASSPIRQPEPEPSVQEELQRIPSDPELAQAWEESQLEEAKRASMAYQIEQQELQEAMRLSMADAEARGIGSSTSAYEGGSSGQNHSISTIPEDRSVSETSHDGEMRDLVSGMEDMIIPGSYTSAPSTASIAPNSAPIPQPQDLLDEPDSQYPSQAPISPQRTGLHIQSKNPFLSSNEKEQLQAMEEAALTTPTSEHFRSPSMSPPGSLYTYYSAPNGPPPQVHRQSFSSYAESGPSNLQHNQPPQQTPPPISSREGSSYTQYTPPTSQQAISSEQNQQLYTPPSAPPPSHLRIVTPTSPSTRPLPATPRDQAPWDESASPRIAFPQPIISPTTQSNSALASPGGTLDSHNSLHQTLQGTPPPLPLRRKSTFVPTPGKEDALEMLRDFDTVFLVDDSTSMAGQRWSEARQALMEVSEIAARYDENGVDIYFLNSKRVGKELKAAHEVEDLFRGLEPKGATPTGMRLESILREYMARLERSHTSPSPSPSSPSINGQSEGTVKPMNLIVVTDGAPTDDPESVLIACAKRLDRGEYPLSQVGVQFLQIGDDSEAREALQELDDGLAAAHGVRDIVDTVLYDGEDMSAGLIIKTLLGGINRRLDRRSSA
ncbi:uncharacterized protein I303_108392 [Kwoniella dejecticola CBS 10117]|uniref:VWFA domain-containing protein n=1 Tax=Kwoniella dejecticola CBS 10117 TaxID=1296121 RepID=A0AAJ8KY89_9TREE